MKNKKVMKREIRDPIHGFINRSEDEERVIDTPLFQRLRRIRQLAMANLVYPGATHTRFDHSLGVMHIAGLMAENLIENSEEKINLRLMALLHDIGHGPFSHVSEKILEMFMPETISINEGKKIHELITEKIIRSDNNIKRILKQRIENILDIVDEKTDSTLKGIITGPLDADKQDYLLRDSYFCGVKYGIFDMPRLHNSLRPHKDKRDCFLAINGPDGVHAVEQYILAKYYMTTQVYSHKVRLLTDAMIIRAIELGINVDNITFLKDIYKYANTPDYINNFILWDDERLTSEILKGDDRKLSKQIFEKLKKRMLFKRIFQSKLEVFPAKIREKLSDILKPKNIPLRKQLEKKIAIELKCEKHFVILNSFIIKSVRTQTFDSEASIIVSSDTGKESFEEASTLFKSIDKAMQEGWVEIYIPIVYKDGKDKKQKLCEFQKKIQSVIIENLTEEKNGTNAT